MSPASGPRDVHIGHSGWRGAVRPALLDRSRLRWVHLAPPEVPAVVPRSRDVERPRSYRWPSGDQAGRGGRRAKRCRREIIDAILYVVDNGIKWRALPADFPPWSTVYNHFADWERQDATQWAVSTILDSSSGFSWLSRWCGGVVVVQGLGGRAVAEAAV